jgi:hypothetical protein
MWFAIFGFGTGAPQRFGADPDAALLIVEAAGQPIYDHGGHVRTLPCTKVILRLAFTCLGKFTPTAGLGVPPQKIH